ncbi:CMGC/DYRK protein kinase [Edhazardia aedis USNM 41457]|uniref:CMGC/DYRK protein kinase n=1 Tax=Edhazardia aedis (strain USNM 41457) TaxID=1003232 RepID=J9D412_EDHAE|nr:CMGC/DYRK protein kinase [Edhazardia aedis USNM 41457]|eukprot:EJW02284.1 CMGC/DYRK protein kinase [Edhazardia aedis USNM 41457]
MHPPANQKNQQMEDQIDENNLFLRRGDVIFRKDNSFYTVLSKLGKGTFGHVYKCTKNNKLFAVKVIRSETAYFNHGYHEIQIMKKLKSQRLTHCFSEYYEDFMFNNHLCISMEILGYNLYEVLKIGSFKGFEHGVLKRVILQVANGLDYLNRMGIVHCDLKPENILVSDPENVKVKIIDFGNALDNTKGAGFYVQSRYYRAPEVILGLPYDFSVDSWSFGCIIYELFIGSPLFPGKNNGEMVERIVSVLGNPPNFMIENGVCAIDFFEKVSYREEVPIRKTSSSRVSGENFTACNCENISNNHTKRQKKHEEYGNNYFEEGKNNRDLYHSEYQRLYCENLSKEQKLKNVNFECGKNNFACNDHSKKFNSPGANQNNFSNIKNNRNSGTGHLIDKKMLLFENNLNSNNKRLKQNNSECQEMSYCDEESEDNSSMFQKIKTSSYDEEKWKRSQLNDAKLCRKLNECDLAGENKEFTHKTSYKYVLRSSSNINYMSFKDFFSKIMSQRQDAVQNELLIDLILYILNLNYIERPLPSQIKLHPYFAESIDNQQNIDYLKEKEMVIERNMINPVPTDKIDRRYSLHDTVHKLNIGKNTGEYRKQSAYNVVYQNEAKRNNFYNSQQNKHIQIFNTSNNGLSTSQEFEYDDFTNNEKNKHSKDRNRKNS